MSQNRRTYLIRRLSTGEVTLEEARELFQVMQQEADDLRAALLQAAPPPSPKAAPGTSSRAPAGGTPTSGGLGMNLEELLLFAGPAAGILAAIMKRSQEPR